VEGSFLAYLPKAFKYFKKDNGNTCDEEHRPASGVKNMVEPARITLLFYAAQTGRVPQERLIS